LCIDPLKEVNAYAFTAMLFSSFAGDNVLFQMCGCANAGFTHPVGSDTAGAGPCAKPDDRGEDFVG
jgi:hypothetical protein